MQDVQVAVRHGQFTTLMQWGGSGAPLLFPHGAGGPMVVLRARTGLVPLPLPLVAKIPG